MVNLRRLVLARTSLETVPAGIQRLTKLSQLELSANRLSSLPPDIGALTELTHLDASHNQIAIVPPEIGALTALVALDLSENEIESPPTELGGLVSLQTLDLANNRIVELPDLSALPLRALFLDGNPLAEVPEWVASLRTLRTLQLSATSLQSVPPELSLLPLLTFLDLRDNQLRLLPPEFGALRDDIELRLEGNPWNEPLPGLIATGTLDVLTYLRSLAESDEQYQAKILLVGEGNVGKSSLVAALRDDPFVEGRPTTHGIELRVLRVPHPSLPVKIALNTWDFGGQEVYRITHQFFFSRRALYLLVWKPREGQEENAIAQWCRRIRLRVGEDARILIVATHADERRPELDYPGLQRHFGPMLAGRLAVDNSSGAGLAELRAAIAAECAALPQMGERMSRDWIAARDKVLAHPEPQIPFDEFVETCSWHGLNEAAAATLARLLHELGHVIYYGEDDGLRDVIVLQPEWLTKAIGYVLEDGAPGERDGVITHRRLAEIWAERGGRAAYPSHYHPYFLRLMEKFDVSFRIPDENASLIGQLVPYERPDLPWDAKQPAGDGERTLSIVCTLDEPVDGLLAWLIVRHHRFSVGLHWRTGVFLAQQDYGAQALLEMEADQTLTLTVRGPSPDAFFSILRDGIEYLIQKRWPTLGYELLVPCPGVVDDNARCTEHFKFRQLLRLRERGRPTVDCRECFTEWDVGQLLTGFAAPEAPLQRELEQVFERLSEIREDVGAVRTATAETAIGLRMVLRAVNQEVTDCPRLFVLGQERRKGGRLLKRWEDLSTLVLWCEHPDHEHPWPAASYEIRSSPEWLRQIAPYAALVVKTLQLAAPVAGAVVGVLLPDDKERKAQVDLMKALVQTLPLAETSDSMHVETPGALTRAEGAGLRALRETLLSLDESRAFGGLRRRQTPSGDFVWVCPAHDAEYDPGLPSLPGTAELRAAG